MPWTIQSRVPAPGDAICPACQGNPPAFGDGVGQCAACGVIYLGHDPGPAEVFRLELIPLADDGRPVSRRLRRSIQVEWGERRQADGTAARVLRVIDRQNDHYVERVRSTEGTLLQERDEPLSHHRGHGAARADLMGSQPPTIRRRWAPW